MVSCQCTDLLSSYGDTYGPEQPSKSFHLFYLDTYARRLLSDVADVDVGATAAATAAPRLPHHNLLSSTPLSLSLPPCSLLKTPTSLPLADEV